jgi:polyisoprenoid-binding protein YceI
MVATVRGRFNAVSGTIEVGDELAGSSTDVTIDAASIDTGSEERDTHLRSLDFLDVERFPTLLFRATRVERREREREHRIFGDLTIRDVRHEVELGATYNGTATDPWGNLRAGLEAETAINRIDWGLTWNTPLEAGGILVGDKVKITLDVSAVKR